MFIRAGKLKIVIGVSATIIAVLLCVISVVSFYSDSSIEVTDDYDLNSVSSIAAFHLTGRDVEKISTRINVKYGVPVEVESDYGVIYPSSLYTGEFVYEDDVLVKIVFTKDE